MNGAINPASLGCLPAFRISLTCFAYLFWLLCSCAILALSCEARAEGARKALVIGMGDYENLDMDRQTPRAANDARAISEKLKALGFAVTQHISTPSTSSGAGARVGLSDFWQAIDDFAHTIQRNDVAVFYFAGHGVQRGGINYLLPSDAPSPTRVSSTVYFKRLVPLTDILDILAAKNPQARVLIIDACRNDPYREAGVRTASDVSGPAPPNSGNVNGAYIMFSTGYGKTALDRLRKATPPDTHSNSPFTRVFLSVLDQPGLKLDQVLEQTQKGLASLLIDEGHEQKPVAFSDGAGDFCLNSPCRVSSGKQDEVRVELPRQSHLTALEAQAQVAWNALKPPYTKEKLAAFMKRFPDTFASDMAEVELKSIADSHATGRVKAGWTPSVAASERAPTEAAQKNRVSSSSLFDDYLIGYYDKPSDNGAITSMLRTAGIRFSLLKSVRQHQSEPTNAILCGNGVPADVAREMAYLMTRSGIGVKAIISDRNFKNPKQLLLVNAMAANYVRLDSPDLTLQQIKTGNWCQ